MRFAAGAGAIYAVLAQDEAFRAQPLVVEGMAGKDLLVGGGDRDLRRRGEYDKHDEPDRCQHLLILVPGVPGWQVPRAQSRAAKGLRRL